MPPRPFSLLLLGLSLGCTPAMFSAAKSGDVAKLEARKNAGDDLEACFVGNTPLAYAAQWEQVEAVKKLLALGAKVDGVCVEGGLASTPLRSACTAGNLEIVKLLVEHGAAVNGVEHPTGWILPLEAAAGAPADAAERPRRVAIIRYLRSKGADPNHKGRASTPLARAKDEGFTEAVAALEEPLPEPKAEPKLDAKP